MFSEAFRPSEVLKPPSTDLTNKGEGPRNPSYPDAKAADGTKIGDDNRVENSDSRGDRAEKNHASLEEMKSKNRENHQNLEAAGNANLDWPPAYGNPEATEHLARNLETSFNAVT